MLAKRDKALEEREKALEKERRDAQELKKRLILAESIKRGEHVLHPKRNSLTESLKRLLRP